MGARVKGRVLHGGRGKKGGKGEESGSMKLDQKTQGSAEYSKQGGHVYMTKGEGSSQRWKDGFVSCTEKPEAFSREAGEVQTIKGKGSLRGVRMDLYLELKSQEDLQGRVER